MKAGQIALQRLFVQIEEYLYTQYMLEDSTIPDSLIEKWEEDDNDMSIGEMVRKYKYLLVK